RQYVSVLGATGSIGVNTLDVIGRNRERFGVAALTARRNVDRLAEQCAQFDAALAVIADPALESALAAALRARGARAAVMSGEAGLTCAAGLPECDIVMAAIVGAAGLQSTFHAARCGKKILLANKESLVVAGEVFVAEARDNGAQIVPVDSEHNAIFQSLPPGFEQGLEAAGVEKIILTASGGPFLDTPPAQLSRVTPEQACRHPNWTMGRKISVDSATLMNKGLEVIEARWLFNARPDQIEVLIHPQSIVHSMVAYRDGSVLAQLGTPDMRTPIAHALAWPERIEAGVGRLNLAQMNDLSFREPDLQRFPCLGLAFEAMRRGDSAPAVLNAANEVAVESFLQGRIGFDRIPALVGEVMNRAAITPMNSLEDVLGQDRAARRLADELVEKLR
ncbi:MAG: 1-deoxy-D-xylulose-5-phosphate reductoisomerase, partial [Xanthomonadales bacterium]|nr:1-deoxy-D-xylulose-5-phosphate reductoisomerase [Xanthomonadales bacterium]